MTIFKKISDNVMQPVKEDGIYYLEAKGSVRIAPFEKALVYTGVALSSLGRDEILMITLDKTFAHHRPFILTNGIEVLSSKDKGIEICLSIYNRGKFPALIDANEIIANAFTVAQHTIEKVKVRTKTEGK